MKKEINMSCAHKYRGQKEMSVLNILNMEEKH